MSRPRKPADLGIPGRRLWDAVSRDLADQGFSLTGAEAVALEQAARLADSVAAMQVALASSTVVVDGYKGQPRAHPLITQITTARNAIARIVRGLKMPDEPAAESRPKDRGRQYAAQTRTRSRSTPNLATWSPRQGA